MSDKMMKMILSGLTVVLLLLIIGLIAMKGSNEKADLNKLALRIGELRQYKTMSRSDVNSAMEKAFARVGYNVVTTTEDNLYPQTAADAGVNLYIRGYTPYNEVKTNKKGVNVVYIRSYDSLFEDEIKVYDGVATSSPEFYNYLLGAGYAAAYVPELTDTNVFYPAPKKELERDVLYVGDNERPSITIAAAVEAELPLEIYGRFWNGNIDDNMIKGEYIYENDLGSYFSSAKINLVNMTEQEVQLGIIPSRVYDIAASKGFMIAPYNKELERVFGDSIPMYKNAEELKKLYNQYINDEKARAEKAEKAYKIAVSEYNADLFVQRMNGLVEFLINEKKL